MKPTPWPLSEDSNVGCWGQDPVAAEEMAKAKADLYATLLRNAVELCMRPSTEADPERLPDIAQVA